ncbi:MAG: hypothetical protein M1819_003183 [Sarea resinae]|nr:MAG: hypothetical protein M1819_003183 [Sarea resinae]
MDEITIVSSSEGLVGPLELTEEPRSPTSPRSPPTSPRSARISPSISSTAAAPSPDHEEHQYLNLIRDILDHGEYRPDRTGTGTLSIPFPPQLRFSLSRPSSDPTAPPIPTLPLLTTKRVHLRSILLELLWFISGSTSSLPLSAAGVKIWDANGSRAYLDSIGLSHRAVGDLGPVYGFQWRHFGAAYVDADADYTGQGVDQLRDVVWKLRHTPYDRRIVLSAWNPADLKLMALPPCHMFAQFYVSYPGTKPPPTPSTSTSTSTSTTSSSSSSSASQPHPPASADSTTNPTTNPNPQNKPQGVLHTLLYQRSCDIGLGVPYNIASYALLTHMLAAACDLVPGTLTHTMGDAHVYQDHVDALRTQLAREPRGAAWPDLVIRRAPGRPEDRGWEWDGADGGGRGVGFGLDGWTEHDFQLGPYDPWPAIKMKMSV